MMTIALAVSIPVVIIAIIGSSIDSIGSGYFKKVACTNNDGQLSGYSSLYHNATYCYDKQILFNNYTTTPNPKTYNCYCSDIAHNCLYLNTKYSSQCTLIFSTYLPTLTAGSIFDFFAWVSILIFSIITCCSVCCPQNFREYNAQDPFGPPPVYSYGQPTVAVASTGMQPVVYGTAVTVTGAPATGNETELYGKPVQGYATSIAPSGGVVYGTVTPPPSAVKY